MTREKLRKYEERLIVFGCPRIKRCISVLSLDHIYFVYTLRQCSCYWKSCMKEFVIIIQKEGPYHIELSLGASGGRVCREQLKNMQRSVINARGLPQAFINLEAC